MRVRGSKRREQKPQYGISKASFLFSYSALLSLYIPQRFKTVNILPFILPSAWLPLVPGSSNVKILGLITCLSFRFSRVSLVAQMVESACNVGDPGLIPWSGRSPGEGNGNPLQYSCLENPMDGGTWQATVHGVAKNQTRLSDFTFLGSKSMVTILIDFSQLLFIEHHSWGRELV